LAFVAENLDGQGFDNTKATASEHTPPPPSNDILQVSHSLRIVAPVLVGQSFSPEEPRLSHIPRREAQALS
jgi:hypothetical protein